ncbi:MAG TPA: GNAT family N-acetyltransferase [Gemmatimonadaceae bacterium]|nr:GNAT family N-acetyltransferase [Gemmatimonadaceae bacterium]
MYTTNVRPSDDALQALWQAAWGGPGYENPDAILSRSLCYICAWADEQLIGFVNVAWDGGIHASIFDTCVHPSYRHRGIGTALVRHAADEARRRGAHWLHVDFESRLTGFYHACGFRPTAAGLIKLA